MKKVLVLLLFVLMTMSLYGQTMIEGFNMARPDSGSFATSKEGNTRITLTQNTTDKKEGVSSTEVNTMIGALQKWGSYSQIGFLNKDSSTQDWSLSDTLSIWIKVKVGPTIPANMLFRIHISDKPSKGDQQEQYIYENVVVLDAVHDWYLLKAPLIERNQPGADKPDSTGFILAPTDWGGFNYNNRKLDRDKIYDWTLGVITSGWDPNANIPADSVIVLYDGFQRSGNRAVPVLFFNGKTFTTPISNGPSAWGQSSLNIIPNPDVPNSNMIEWVQGNEWNNGWSGWNEDITPTNMVGLWKQDSLKFKMKSDAGVGPVRVQLAGVGGGLVGSVFTPNGDGQWHDYAYSLKAMTYQDGKTSIDSTQINKLEFMAEGSAIVGKKLYFSEIKIGNPVYDVIAPVKPTGLAAAVEDQAIYKNTLAWDKHPEAGIKFNAYVSDAQWTDISSPAVIGVPPVNVTLADAAAIGTTSHFARTPNVDKSVTLYYGLTATDGSANVSAPSFAAPLTMTGRGVPTIAKKTINFVADGELNEWQNVTPFDIAISKSTGRSNTGGIIGGDVDLSAKAYVTIDANYLYVAYDVTDDVYSVDSTKETYLMDSPDLFIGLYDWDGKLYAGPKTTGANVDLHFRFCVNKVLADNGTDPNKNMYYNGGANYRFVPKVLDPGYVVEAKIALADIKKSWPGLSTDIVPVNGMRIPIDFVINDNDEVGTTTRQGILSYSDYNLDDFAYRYRWSWTHTWIDGASDVVEGKDPVAYTYALNQNYPNPFNPATNVTFSLANAGQTSVKVYDVLGRLVTTLVSGYQSAGQHTVTFNAQNLASGLYLYKIESGNFKAIKKMMLLK